VRTRAARVSPRFVATGCIVVAAVMLGTCARPPDEAVSVASGVATVEVPEIGLQVTVDTSVFTGHAAGGRPAVLETADPADPGRILIEARPPEVGQNLPAAVAEHRSFIDQQDEGAYLGSQELVSPLGTAFTSRARYRIDGRETEETVVFALHPSGGRMITLTYRYPAGDDSATRVGRLLEVLESVEPM
jgi:hypothetical protein